MVKQEEIEKLKKEKRKYVKWAVLFSVISLLMPILMTMPTGFSFIDWGSPSSIGDTFGGITAPFISIVAIWVTFQAFWVQYEFNYHQRNALKEQRDDILLERFENRFFTFINLFREQERDTFIPNVGYSKQAFHFMFYEYKALCYQLHAKDVFKGVDDRETQEKHQAFGLFINGVSCSSMSRLLEESPTANVEKLKKLNDELLQDQKKALESSIELKYLRDYTTSGIKLFDGHRLHLVPFYRSFCMNMEYVYRNVNEGIVKEKDVYFYRDLLFSQMSEHEMALLKIMYTYGAGRDVDFIHPKYKARAKNFFETVLPQFLKSKTMNCVDIGFIDYGA